MPVVYEPQCVASHPEEYNTKLVKNKFSKIYAFISYQYNILPKFKKKLNSVGISPMDLFYKEK